MGKLIGMFLVLSGIAGFLYSWILAQKTRHRRLEELIVFLQKSVFAMEEEKVRIIAYFENYRSRDVLLEELLQEIAQRLRQNQYPGGQLVWEEVFREKKEAWNCDEETFGMILAAGNGFFGKKRSENVCFLRRSLKQLEMQREKSKEKDTQERKVWIPVGMLGGIMLMIILI